MCSKLLLSKWKKKEKRKQTLERKKNIKNVIKSDKLIHFCLTISSAFCTDESVSALRKSVQGHFYKLSIEWLQACSSSKKLITLNTNKFVFQYITILLMCFIIVIIIIIIAVMYKVMTAFEW